MYNFLNSKLLPKVAPITGSLEGYEPTNLISESPITKSRGFLTYSCIKPPVDIDFELICPVCIHYIVISCKLGTQRIVGVELQAKSNGPEYTTIAHGYFNEDKAVFCDLKYYSRNNPPSVCTSGVYLGFFKGHLHRIFSNAKFIRVRILRTERSTPCLGPVEIWGKVAKSCPKVTVETIEKLMTKKLNKDENNVKIDNYKSQGYDFEICDDFKDALTFEIMAIPMTLPSGHSVDQSTLERCAKNDAMYGRQCCDPFTGLPFTDSRKPKLNTALKNRIDMFLLQNAHRKETFSISRTVGRSNQYDKLMCSDSSINIKTEILKDDPSTIPVLKKTLESNQGKRNTTNTIQCDADNYNINNKRIKLDYQVQDRNNYASSNNKKPLDSDNSALDAAIAKVMSSSGFVTFTKENTDDASEVIITKCCVCDNSNNLYQLPCLHVHCRACLLNVCKSLLCNNCGKGFCRNDVKKIHTG